MSETVPAPESNSQIWKSDEGLAYWVATAEQRERRREEQRRLVAELLPFDPSEEFTFVDLGAGTGAGARVVMDCFPHSKAVLADFSPQMQQQALEEMDGYEGRFFYVEMDLESGIWPSTMPDTVDAVISSLCVHHLPDEAKMQLFALIREHLVPGGWYLNYDPVKAPDPLVEEAWQRASDRRDPQAAYKRHHRSAYEQRRWENHVRFMTTLPVQVEMLARAGFEAIDVYWKHLDEVIYGGRRPR